MRNRLHRHPRAARGVGTALLNALLRAVSRCDRIWLVTTNDNLEALRFYQRRGFVLSALRPGAVEEARKQLKPQISTVGEFESRCATKSNSSCGRDRVDGAVGRSGAEVGVEPFRSPTPLPWSRWVGTFGHQRTAFQAPETQ